MSGVHVAFVVQPQCRRCPQRRSGRQAAKLLKKISPGRYKLTADFCNKIGP